MSRRPTGGRPPTSTESVKRLSRLLLDRWVIEVRDDAGVAALLAPTVALTVPRAISASIFSSVIADLHEDLHADGERAVAATLLDWAAHSLETIHVGVAHI